MRYEGTTQLEKKNIERSIWLDLGNAYETAEVFVNGKSAGVRICKPYRFELTGLLKEGENRLAIEVTNTLGTQMRDAISHYLPIEPFGVERNGASFTWENKSEKIRKNFSRRQ